jgi:hypothetical protein
VSTSLEKVDALSATMLRAEEQFEGLLGLVQMAVALEKSGMSLPGVGSVSILDGLPEDPAELDEQLLGVAGFILWLRSDDAPPIDPNELAHAIPAEIAELAAAAGLVA